MNDLSLHILDIIQNSISAKASVITLTVKEEILKNRLVISIEDNGCGMTEEQVEKLSDPFFTSRTTRKVGLGVPLLKHTAEQTGGEVLICSKEGEGTTIQAIFIHDNIDRPPLGDVANAFVLTLSMNDNVNFILKYFYNENEFVFDSEEVKEILGDMPLNLPSVMKYLEELIIENISELKS